MTDLIRKPADNDHPIHDLLRERWSPRAFADRPVTDEQLLSLFEAARWSQSCFNDQPWFFILATQAQPDSYAKLLSCLTDSNQTWAKRAPVLMLMIARLTFEADGSPNHHALYDLGQAMQNLTVQATSMELVIRQMAGIHPDHAQTIYQIPDGYRVLAGAALGYQGTIDILSEKHQQREVLPRERKPLSAFVFSDRFGETAPFIAE